jgi:Carboxypeptidase regulatory-like domain
MAYRAVCIAITCLFLLADGVAVRELVIIEKPQPARHVEGTVFDPSGAPVPDMTVTDRSEQWISVLRSTTTDSKGHFRFSRQPGKTVYYLRFDHPGFNPLELKLKLDNKSAQRAITVNAPIGG